MPYCANRNCPHRLRVGRPPEYADGTEHCAECGEPLTPGHTPKSSARTPLPWPAPLRRRLWVTVGAVLAVWLLMLVPNPFFDLEVLAAIKETSWFWASLDEGPFSLGLWPIFSAFVVVELGALAVPRWNKRRHGDAAFRDQMNKTAIALGLALALIQGYAVAAFLMASPGYLSVQDLGLIPNPGYAFRLKFALTHAAGTGVVTLLALAVSRAGVGNGFAVVFLADSLIHLPLITRGTLKLIGTKLLTAEYALLYGLGVAVIAAGMWWVLNRPTRRTSLGMPIPAPSCGSWSLDLTVIMLLVPAQIALLASAPVPGIATNVLSKGASYTTYLEMAIVLLTAPLASWIFYWRYRHVLNLPGNAMDWFRARFHDAGLLVAILLLWELLHAAAGEQNRTVLTALALFLLVAIASDLWAEIQARRRAPGEADLVPLASYQHPVDALVDLQDRPPETGATIQHLRYRSLTYFLGPFVPLRILGATEIPLVTEWTDAADADLDAIADELESDDPEAADELVQRILDAAEGLVEPVSPDDDSADQHEPREIAVDETEYFIEYRVRKYTAEVVHVARRSDDTTGELMK